MSVHLCIFEDDRSPQFLPLAHFRPVYDLRCGIFSLREKILRAYPRAAVSLHCRPLLAAVLKMQNPVYSVNEIPSQACLFVNGRVLADRFLAKKIPQTSKQDTLYVSGGTLVAAFMSGSNLEKIKSRLASPLTISDFDGLQKVDVEVETVGFPWDLVQKNGTQIEKDFETMVTRSIRNSRGRARMPAGVHLLGKKNILIEKGARIDPGTVLDAEYGPIFIGKGVRIFPQSVIIGPACVLEGSSVKIGAQIYENTTIGPVCKVGGEVEGSILQGYSNKQHAGFLGHSYLGSWVNLGAGTNTSDLKNNYSSVRVQMADRQVDTGLSFVGLTMGDHAKTAINSMLNTGTVVGVCSNVFGAGFPPKYVPSFSWGGSGESLTTYDIDKAVDVARRVMARRGIHMSADDEQLFRDVFAATAGERTRSGMKQ